MTNQDDEVLVTRMSCLNQATATLLAHGQVHCASVLRELQGVLDKIEQNSLAGENSIWKSNDPVGILEYLYDYYCESS